MATLDDGGGRPPLSGAPGYDDPQKRRQPSFAGAVRIWLVSGLAGNGYGWWLVEDAGGYGLGGMISALGALGGWAFSGLLLPQASIVAAIAICRGSWRPVGIGAAIILLTFPFVYAMAVFAIAVAVKSEQLALLVPICLLGSAPLAALTWWLLPIITDRIAARPPTPAATQRQPWLSGGRQSAPPAVWIGVDLLRGAFALNVFGLIVLAATSSGSGAIVACSMRLMISAPLIFLIARRHAWARAAYLVFFLATVMASVNYPYHRFEMGSFLKLLAICEASAQGAALVLLLFSPAAHRWYRPLLPAGPQPVADR
jgi:hypothetical protein